MRRQLTKIALTATFGLAIIFTSCGPSAAEIAIRSAPSVEAVKGLKDKLIWLQGNVQSGGSYTIEIDADEKDLDCGVFSSCTALSYKDKSDIKITLKGIGANRTIYSGFNVGTGVTLILDDNITLQGGGLRVYGGTLVMNDGSTITGARFKSVAGANSCGGGVHVAGGGTFLMKGGTISQNVCLPTERVVGCANMKCDKKIITSEAEILYGGGVYVSGEGNLFGKTIASGTFIKTGGTITGYTSDPENGNVIIGIDGNPTNGYGHAVFLDGKEKKAIDTTVGPEMTLDFRNGILKEGRNE